MDKKTMKLVLGMPPELLKAWETAHPEKWSIRFILKNLARRGLLSFGFFLVWFMSMIAVGMVVTTYVPKWSETLVIIASIFSGFAGAPLVEFIFHRSKWIATLELLEEAVRDTHLNLMDCLQKGYDLKRIREFIHSRLVLAAKCVIDAEEGFKAIRLDLKYSESDIGTALTYLGEFRVTFDRMLARAVEFGDCLSDCNQRQYFEEAERKT